MSLYERLKGLNTWEWSYRIRDFCKRNDCAFACYVLPTDEILCTDNLKSLHYIIRSHFHFMYDELKQPGCLFIVGDKYGSLYLYVYDNKDRYIIRVQCKPRLPVRYRFEYTTLKVRG